MLVAQRRPCSDVAPPELRSLRSIGANSLHEHGHEAVVHPQLPVEVLRDDFHVGVSRQIAGPEHLEAILSLIGSEESRLDALAKASCRRLARHPLDNLEVGFEEFPDALESVLESLDGRIPYDLAERFLQDLIQRQQSFLGRSKPLG